MMAIRALPTWYGGICFRSKLEASWAKYLDSIGVKWIYEPQGYELSSGAWYLPDFYLPEADAYLEVKGQLDDESFQKGSCFARDIGKPVHFALPMGEMAVCYEDEEAYRWEIDEVGNYMISRCHKCGRVWIKPLWDYWGCSFCGWYDGDSGFDSLCRDWTAATQIDVRRRGR
jgi:hypothetical protein